LANVSFLDVSGTPGDSHVFEEAGIGVLELYHGGVISESPDEYIFSWKNV
jgi:hypothetical protein